MPIGILAYIWLCDWQQWDLALSVINFCLSFAPWVVNDLLMASLRPQFFATPKNIAIQLLEVAYPKKCQIP